MYRLQQISPGPFQGRQIDLGAFQRIGRSSTNQIIIDDPLVSREQAVIHVSGSMVSIQLLDLTAPVLVNGQQIFQGYNVRPGDIIQFGQTQFELLDTEIPSQPTVKPTQANQPFSAQTHPTQAIQASWQVQHQ